VRVRIDPDRLDLEALQDWLRHPGYAIYRERLTQAHGQLLDQLKRAPSWEESLKLQGRIHEIERDLALPGVIAADIRKRLK
jgi:hypothetical protein